jgi:FkbM family methyltransferase
MNRLLPDVALDWHEIKTLEPAGHAWSKQQQGLAYRDVTRLLGQAKLLAVPDSIDPCEPSKILIIGNGPSTGDLANRGFDSLPPGIDTFGMGAAYRYFREIDWWPDFYALGDKKVVHSHREALASLAHDPAVTTQRFFFSLDISDDPRFEVIDHTSTGDFCYLKALELGYREIYLIGIEGNYVEEIAESRLLTEAEIHERGFDELGLTELARRELRVIATTPDHNPNYFIAGYQQKGDVYSLPRAAKHRQRWGDAANTAESLGVKVTNLSRDSKIRVFPKSSPDHLMGTYGVPGSGSSDVVGDSGSADSLEQSLWFGSFDRQDDRRIDESQVAHDLLRDGLTANKPPRMVDVGAARGQTFRGFAEEHWTVHAFEPNPILYEMLTEQFDWPNVFISDSAVSDRQESDLPFYTSDESVGISTLEPFRPSHMETSRVSSTTLDDYLEECGIVGVDFLKIDTEGLDLMVLKGVDLHRHDVRVILCEFEDRKSVPLGYSMTDMAKHLVSHGFTVYVSEWHPVIRYGGPHHWRRLSRYPYQLEEPDAWGNLIAFKEDPGMRKLAESFQHHLRDSNGSELREVGRYAGINAGKSGKRTAELNNALARIEELETRRNALQNRVEYMANSKSWRLTSPLRAIMNTVKGSSVSEAEGSNE